MNENETEHMIKQEQQAAKKNSVDPQQCDMMTMTMTTATTTAVWMHGYIWNGFSVARAFVDSFQLFAMNIKIALRFNITCAVINEWKWMLLCVCV